MSKRKATDPRLTQEMLDGLERSLNGVCYENWDAEISVDQDSDTGVLTFKLTNEDGDVLTSTATPVGVDAPDGPLYNFKGPDSREVTMTLVPVCICGLMGL